MILENINQYVLLNPFDEDTESDYEEKMKLIDDSLKMLRLIEGNGKKISNILYMITTILLFVELNCKDCIVEVLLKFHHIFLNIINIFKLVAIKTIHE